MISESEIIEKIGQPEGDHLEYKAVLPPSRVIAQLIAGFANTDGGYIILGVSTVGGAVKVHGLGEDFRANAIVHKALDLIPNNLDVSYSYVSYQSQQLFAIRIVKSPEQVVLQGKIYIREGSKTKIGNELPSTFSRNSYSGLVNIGSWIENIRPGGTDSKTKLLEHYKNVLQILDDLQVTLYPAAPSIPTNKPEGKILMRILFSSCADNFESYLTDLLYEIYLAKPETLKSNQTVTVLEVLQCADMQEFVVYFAKKTLSKLQRGSVRGFIKENKQISKLGAIDEAEIESIEKYLQIRHLYSHRNGIVDEKFLQYFGGAYILNQEHLLSLDEMLQKMTHFATIVNKIDTMAIAEYNLASV